MYTLSWIFYFLCYYLYNLQSSCLTHALTINQYEIRDLEYIDSSFTTEASLWTASNTISSSITSQCYSSYILGGYGVVGPGTNFTRVYTSLAPHNLVYFHFGLWAIDFDADVDMFQMYFDGVLVNDFNTISSGFNYAFISFCGGSKVDFPGLHADGQAKHSASTLTVSIVSAVRSGIDVFSFGIRNISFLFQSTPDPSDLTCQITNAYTQPVSCLCPTGQYGPSGAGASGCLPCSSSCQSCFGPYPTNCTSCAAGKSFDGQTCYSCDASCNQCNGTTATDCIRCIPGKYLYPNGTCLSACSSPLIPYTVSSYSSCYLPCSTPGDFYYSQNSSCKSDCPSDSFDQVIQGDLKLCNFKCTGNDYLYWNNTCDPSCAPPLVPNTAGIESYCNLPCGTSDFLYQNGSCITGCSISTFDSSSQGDLKLCTFKCPSGSYLYSNGTCSSSCPYPFVNVTAGVERYCNVPCSDASYFLYQNESCYATCPSNTFVSITQGDLKLCNFECINGGYLYWNGSCNSSCPYPLINTTSEVEKYCSLPCNNAPDFFYQNGSCLGSCPSTSFVSTSQGDLKLCNFRCADSSYLYQNGTCDSNCLLPFSSATAGVEKYCNLPCNNTSDFFYQNGTCQANCNNATFVEIGQGELKLCDFICSNNDYLLWNGTCNSTCSSPYLNQTVGVEKYCNLPCNNTSNFFYQNGTCQANCNNATFVEIDQGELKLCNFICPKNSYLLWNGTCNSTCSSPYSNQSIGFEKYCNLPCPNSSFLYQNTSCHSTCSAPFIPQINSSIKYCNFACPSPTYLYWNNTCNSTCPYPFLGSTNGFEKYCKLPCPTSSFYYQNQTCNSACPLPFTQRIDTDMNYCDLPCPSSMFLLLPNGSCVSNCPDGTLPIQDGLLKVCQPIQIANSTASDVFDALKSAAKVANIVGILRPSSPSSAFMTALAKIVKYVKVLDVPILDDVRDQLNLEASGAFSISLTFTVPMPDNINKLFPKHRIPTFFEKSDYHSSFVVNHWESMSVYLILIGSGFFASLVELVAQKYWLKKTVLIAIIRRIRIIVRWNLFLFTLYNTYDDITLFSILELQTIHFASPAATISFLTCLLVSFGALLILIKNAFICRGIIKMNSDTTSNKSQQSINQLKYSKWEHFQVLYAGCKDISLLTQSYFVIYIVRIIICYLIVGILYQHPLVQTVQLTLMSTMALFYLIKFRPIEDPLNFIIILVYEILAFVVNICVLILAISQAMQTLTPTYKKNLSYTILGINTTINTFSGIVTWVYVANGIWSAYKASKRYGLHGKTTWLNVPLASYQNPAMDFDEQSCVQPCETNGMSTKSSMKPKKIHPLSVSNQKELAYRNLFFDIEDDKSRSNYIERGSTVLSPVNNLGISELPDKSLITKRRFNFTSELSSTNLPPSRKNLVRANMSHHEDLNSFVRERQFSNRGQLRFIDKDNQNLSNMQSNNELVIENENYEESQVPSGLTGVMRNFKEYIQRKTKPQVLVMPKPEDSSARDVGRNEKESIVLKPALSSETTWRLEDIEEKKQKIRATLGKMRRRIVPIN